MQLFFDETRYAVSEISDLFDFVWAAAPAMWNLRQQVETYLDESPKATPQEIYQRFVVGSGIHGSNLRKACIDTTWEEQKSRFAGVVLTNAFAVYEYWADSILTNFPGHNFRGKNLQFEGNNGVQAVLAQLCASTSPVLSNAFYPIYAKSRKHSPALLSNYIKCYRYFKEGRNAQIHGGGRASANAVAAYTAFAPVADRLSLGMKENIAIEPFVPNGDIKLHLRGVVGFCDILIRIMTTVDAELSRSAHMEDVLEHRLRGAANQPSMLSTIASRRHKQVVKRCRTAKLPKPADSKVVYDFLRRKRIITV